MKLLFNSNHLDISKGANIELTNAKELVNIKIALAEYRNNSERIGDIEKVNELDKMLDALIINRTP